MSITSGSDLPSRGTVPNMTKEERHNLSLVRLQSFLLRTQESRDELASSILTAFDFLREQRFLYHPDLAIASQLLKDIYDDITESH